MRLKIAVALTIRFQELIRINPDHDMGIFAPFVGLPEDQITTCFYQLLEKASDNECAMIYIALGMNK